MCQIACSVTMDKRKVTSFWYQRLKLMSTFFQPWSWGCMTSSFFLGLNEEIFARDVKYYLVNLPNIAMEITPGSQVWNLNEKLNEPKELQWASFIFWNFLFKLSEIHTFYVNRLEDLGIKYSASSLKSGFFSFLVKVANSAIISQVCIIES